MMINVKRNSAPTISRFVEDTKTQRPAIVLVHGLGGSASTTWRKLYDCFAEDPAFSDYVIDTYSYPTSLFSFPFAVNPPGLHSLSDGLDTFIEERHSSRTSVVLVAHSLGGLIARQFIVSHYKSKARVPVSKLVLVAVPNSGAALANVASHISWPHRQLKLLCRDHDGLRSLNLDWQYHAFDEMLDVRYVLGGSDRVVEHDSAYPYALSNKRSVIIGADHRSIISPDSRNDIRYRALRRSITAQPQGQSSRSIADQAVVTSKPAQTSELPARKPNPLFEVYTPFDEPFYVHRGFDSVLAATMSDGHIWLIGESGVGKTASLRHAAYKSGWHLNSISLGAYNPTNTLEAFGGLCTELASLNGSNQFPGKESLLPDLFRFMKDCIRHFPSDLTIVNMIEEIPLDQSELCVFANTLSRFVEILAHETDLHGRVFFAVSSIMEPVSETQQLSAKTCELIQMVKAERWGLNDSDRLISLLSSVIGPQLSLGDLGEISKSADGSPRMIKQIFRRLRAEGGNKPLGALIEQVRLEQVK